MFACGERDRKSDDFLTIKKKCQVYVGLDPPYWTLDPEKLEKAFTDKTKAVVLNR